MASSNGEGAEIMVATDHGECQQLKDLANTENATPVMASSTTRKSVAECHGAVMHPLLLASVCFGDWKGLNFLLNRGEAQADPCLMPSEEFLARLAVYSSTNLLMHRVSGDDIEEGADSPSFFAESLLQGLTPEGDTALHMAAAHGNLRCASIIFSKDSTLLSKPNYKGDTPLHLAARAGKSEMVFHLIDLAIDFGRCMGIDDEKSVNDLLRKENDHRETALHEAIRIGDNHIVKLLMTNDPMLAIFPKDGTSPLYLSILLEKDTIANTLYNMSKGNILSYSGPAGQNALHAAVLRSKAMTRQLLEWNRNLTTQGDINGSTPLHFASSRAVVSNNWVYPHPSIRCFRVPFPRLKVLKEVIEANGTPLYQPDNCGMFPIHVAATVGERSVIDIFVNKFPSSAGLRDKRGRTFLHVAVENKKGNIVDYACRNRSLTWIWNMQDNDGNTALHLAVEAANLSMFCCLFGNRQVQLNLVNVKGQTPRDMAHNKIRPEIHYDTSTEDMICFALTQAGAMKGIQRHDHFEEKYKDIHQLKLDSGREELEIVKDATQTMGIGSVLIATVAFGATFALPGGYKSDDRPHGGAPTLAGRTLNHWLRWAALSRSLFVRTGPIYTFGFLFPSKIVWTTFIQFWPLIFTFTWSAYGRDHLAS
uniref:PGG domain-containing protein n=1 Tax=Leersia perrieri TaxID=77586 RepID=A0A0D9XC15_9ORYZ